MSNINLIIETSIGANLKFCEIDSEGDLEIIIMEYGEESSCYINIKDIDAIIDHLQKQKNFNL